MKTCVAVFLFLSSTAWSTDPAVSVLTAIREAQRGHLTRYPQGTLDARCADVVHEQKDRNIAEVHQEWTGESAYWKYTCETVDSVTGDRKQHRFVDCETITNGKQRFHYNPAIRHFNTSPEGRFGLQYRILDVRPANTWYMIVPTIAEKPIHELIGECLEKEDIGTVETDDKGLVKWRRENGKAWSEIVFDLHQDANVVTLEFSPDKYEGQIVPGFSCSYTWIDDAAGSFRLKKYTGIQYRKSVSDPEREIEIEILNFNAKPQFTSDRFRSESLNLPSGTKMEVYDATPGSHPKVSWKGQKLKQQLSEKQLKKLSDDLQENGTAQPARTPQPR